METYIYLFGVASGFVLAWAYFVWRFPTQTTYEFTSVPTYTGDFEVFVNGKKMEKGDDYVEGKNGTLVFKEPLAVGASFTLVPDGK